LARRVRRVLPAYYFVITAMFLFGDWTLPTFLLHLVFARAELILWTIPQELLFYLILPILLVSYPLLFRRKPLPAVLAFAALATAANLELDDSVFAMHGSGTWMRFHLGIFMTGMITAYLYESKLVRRLLSATWVRYVLDVAGLAILAALFLTAEHYHDVWLGSVPWVSDLFSPMSWSYRGTFGVLSSALISIVLVADRGITSRICRSFPLRALGVVSYSLYLIHWTVMEKFRDLGLDHGTALFVVTLFTSYLVACALYSLVERPFLQVKSRPA
jgi:peptidoglycan/LPS O-acetylase OafA/YrhL